jgi:hypothetical protein
MRVSPKRSVNFRYASLNVTSGVEVAPENSLQCWGCNQHIGQVVHMSRKKFTMQPATMTSTAKIHERDVVCTSHDIRHCINIFIPPSLLWPTRQMAPMIVMIIVIKMGGDSVCSLCIG